MQAILVGDGRMGRFQNRDRQEAVSHGRSLTVAVLKEVGADTTVERRCQRTDCPQLSRTDKLGGQASMKN
jgi:hypothetical protein